MIFTSTALEGVLEIDLEFRKDLRGHFARTFCSSEFRQHGLPAAFVQCNLSFNKRRGTLRGLHWQAEPQSEGKLIRCTAGAVFDVAVDLRQHSPTLYRWVGVELSSEGGRAMYIPPGFAHGFQTLVDNSEVFYQMTEAFNCDFARGARWNDPTFGIVWPVPDPILSDRDRAWPAPIGAHPA